mgnify:CR=1 FL=1
MYKEILVPLDGSELAELAIPHAEALGKAFGSRVTLIYVVEPVSIRKEPGIIGPTVVASLNIEEDMEAGREYLVGVAGRFADGETEVRTEVRHGYPASKICDFARENGTELIVMTTHGRSGVGRWVYGSVADKVLHGAHIPVLLIRAQPKA